MDPKILGLVVALLVPLLLPLFTRKYGLKIPPRKWVVWYLFWIFLTSLVIFQIYTMEHILSVQPNNLDFGPNGTEMSIMIANNGTGLIKWRIQSNLTWLTITPDSGRVSTDRDKVKVLVNRTKIGAGTTTGNFSVIGEREEKVTVKVTVSK